MDGPAVVVEVADTVPVSYITVDSNQGVLSGNMVTVGPHAHANGATAAGGGDSYSTHSLDNMEYDYLYSNSNTSHDHVGVRERQLDFCML